MILDRIVGSCDPEVLTDQVSNLSSAKETVLLLGLVFLQTDSFFEVRIMDDSVFLLQITKILNHPLNQPSPHL